MPQVVVMAGYDVLPCPEGVVPRGVNTPLETVLDYGVVYPPCPAGLPLGEVVFQVEPLHPTVLGDVYSEPSFVSCVVVPQLPHQLTRPLHNVLYSRQMVVYGVQFFLYRWEGFPAYRWMTADRGAVKGIPVAMYCSGLEFRDELK